MIHNVILSLIFIALTLFTGVASASSIELSDGISLKDNTIIVKSQLPSLEYESENWKVLTAYVNDLKICYMVIEPYDKSIGNHTEDRYPNIIITQIPPYKYEISVSTSYEYRPLANVNFGIDGIDYKFIPEMPKTAWSIHEHDIMQIIENIMNGFYITVYSESVLGTYAIDKYYISGASAAYAKMNELCKSY